MLYLEDYLEMIEHLPVELRDRLTEMREMDLSVQNRVDCLQEREKTFFSNCKKLKLADREEEFNLIKKEYKKMLEESDEKVQSASECYSLLDKHLRKLDQELHKFKLELEADNRGITEMLERRSLEMDAPAQQPGAVKENRNPKKAIKRPNQTIVHGLMGTLPSLARPSGADRKSSFLFADLGSPGLDSLGFSSPSSYPLHHIGAGGNTIAAAASQAIAATTQQLVPGRRTSSLKASYDAISLGVHAQEFSVGRELAGAAQTALAATGMASASGVRKQKSHKRSQHADSSSVLDVVNSGTLLDDSLLEGISGTDDLLGGSSSSRTDNSEQDWSFDPSEPRYCVCNQVSYGDMVACDNEDCPYEWFHYPCVGVTAPPKGKWFCPTCTARRKGRK